MRKKIAIILAAAMAAGLAGCSSQTAETTVAQTTATQTEQAQEEAAGRENGDAVESEASGERPRKSTAAVWSCILPMMRTP